MKQSVQPPGRDASTEDKIKEAARKLFTRKGYNATRSRDIASEAGINLALLNYYFRSKEKLFDIIMMENIQHLMQGVLSIINDPGTGFQQKIDLLVANYIDILLREPDLPVFVLSEMRNNPQKLAGALHAESILKNSVFIKQMQMALNEAGIEGLNPLHFVANILSLTVFPFAARPILQRVGGLDDEAYRQMILERKRLIPLWVNAMLTIK